LTSWTLSTDADPGLLLPVVGAPAVPTAAAVGHDFEMQVFAALQCGGWFVEPNPKERDLLELELFEIDAVARKPFAERGHRLLAVEAKSGDWGAKDVMLLLGRGRYIDAEGSVFAYRRDSNRGPLEQRVTPRLRTLGVQTMRLLDVDHPSPENVLAALYQATGLRPRGIDPVCFRTWLDSHLLQGRLRPSWKPLLDQHPDSSAVHAAHRWNVRVYENLPLVAHPIDRLVRQMESFNDFGRLLALRVATETGVADSQATRLPWAVMEGGENAWLQAALLLQHAARLALLATLVEIVVLLPEDDVRALVLGADPRLRPFWRTQVMSLLEHPPATRWPLLWQTYLGCWGGFLLTERRDQEIALIAEEVGTTPSEAEAGLAAFDTLFPQRDARRWHRVTDEGIELLTLVPAALRGVGVLHRLRRHGLYELDGSGRAVVAAALQHGYGTNATAARRMTAWHDVGVTTLLANVA
jgi:hypothetical protein